jgi:uncharacterized membrane protein YhiD involved in acid resistance
MQNTQNLLNAAWNRDAVVSLPAFTLNLLLAAGLAYLLGLAYVRFGQALSNRRSFARNFLLLTITTTLIISIVKSSLALSLGLVGALSIVRFRAAIKEPEELAFLFLAISIGLGLGASQALVTVTAFALVLVLLAVRHWLHRRPDPPNLYLTVTSPAPQTFSVSQVLEALTQAGATASLKRFEQTPELLEGSFLVAFADAAKLESFNQRLRELNPAVRVSYFEERGLGS